MRSLPARLLALFLAVLPVAWGTCPCWIGSGDCGTAAQSMGAGAAKRCGCCEAKRAKTQRGTPSPTEGRGGDDERRNCCDGCPIVEVRHGATPAPVTVEMPDAALLGWALPVPERVPAAVVSFEPHLGVGFAGPPPLVGTVVLIV